jgi:hypothetical protein
MSRDRFALAFLVLLVGCAPSLALAGERIVQTTHYRIHSDLDRELTDDLARRMEAMYDQYARRFAAFVSDARAEPFEVYLFEKRDDYARFTSERFPNTGGVFIPRRKLLAAFLEGQGRDGIRRTLQHEAFHQFAFGAIGPELPIWLNEGLAQIFEDGLWTGSQFMIGQVSPRRVRQLRQDMRDRRLTDFKRFLTMSEEDWSQNLRDGAVAGTQYNQAWAMAHFLIFAPDEDGQPRYRARLIQMLQLIRGGKDAEKAFNSAFSDNIAGFQDRFVEFARQLEPTPEATWIENQTVLADMLTSLKSRGVEFDEIRMFRDAVVRNRYRLQYERGVLHWNSAEDPATYFVDAAGRTMEGDQLFFVNRRGAPLPDLVCRPMDRMQYRTCFYTLGSKIEYEILLEGR